jgi:hypothetical protein
MIEAVVTCVNYGDFLAETLPHNRTVFDKLVVVTAPEDKETRRVCEYWNVECVLSDAFETRWGQFNKGKGINAGLAALKRSDWLVHMDADIVLPPDTRRFIDCANLATDSIYGIDRHVIVGYDAWRRFQASPELQREGWSCAYDSGSFIHLHHFPLGERVAHPTGYVPIGYFQLWHASKEGPGYPDQHTSAGRGDMLHALRWPRAKRHLIPEIIGYHLESEPAAMGANWNGRKTKRFAPGHAT